MPTHDVILGLLAAPLLIMHAYRLARVNNKLHVGDGPTYLRVAREIRMQRTMFPALPFYFTGERERLQLPPLLMILLSPLSAAPYRLLINFPFFFDVMTAAAVGFGGVAVLGLEPWRAILAALVVLGTPINAITSASLTPRSLGLFWLTLFVLFMTAFGTGDPEALIGATCCVALALLSQRMVTQVIFIVGPAAAIVLWASGAPAYLHVMTAIGGGILMALFLTSGRYCSVAVDHARRLGIHLKVGQQDRFRREFGSPLQLAKANPWLLLVLVTVLIDDGIRPEYWLVAAFAVGAAALALLWFLGNGVNHVLFGSPFIALLLAGTLPESPVWLGIVLAVAVASAVVVLREYRLLAERHLSGGWLRCIDFICRERLEGRTLVVPHVGFPPLIYYTSLVLVASGHGSKAMTFDRLTVKIILRDQRRLGGFLQANGVRYVILDREAGDSSISAAVEAACHDTYAAIHDDGLVAIYENRRGLDSRGRGAVCESAL